MAVIRQPNNCFIERIRGVEELTVTGTSREHQQNGADDQSRKYQAADTFNVSVHVFSPFPIVQILLLVLFH